MTSRPGILIVDDNAVLAEDMARSLRNMGYDVVGSVSSGEEAVQVAEATRPDLVLMDIVLQGGIDGMEAAKRIVTRPRPGHADYSGGAATGQHGDMRNVLERASARETAARVAAGAVCSQLLARYGITMRSADY